MNASCEYCGRPLPKKRSGRAWYCRDACRKQAYRRAKRRKQLETARESWAFFPSVVQGHLEALMQRQGEQVAFAALDVLCSCFQHVEYDQLLSLHRRLYQREEVL